ncbi:MAG: hypothetical protein M0Q24_00450 [Sulfurimonas sp.]|uniref:hypothetical protein n=1 Tax=Sulfurimonas sp. TaxID=2022749 RepID=UPI0025E367C0|nr:hypothetical protein [Sulfurimonas sp.]MCK9490530.1 hypothetical protein [Sulfurimonas sp.]
MKSLFIIFLLFFLLQGDELQRIESIINDITKLRVEHEECKKALDSKGIIKVETTKESECESYEKTVEILKTKNISLEKKLQEQTKILKDTENEREIYKKAVKTKEDQIEILKNQIVFLEKKGETKPKVVVKEIIKEKKIYPKDDNIFPTLMPKHTKFKKEILKTKEIEEETKPTTYRLKYDSKIYNEISGDEIYLWEKDRTFTSNIQTQNFTKITGYFIDKKWQKAEEELWIKKVDIFER